MSNILGPHYFCQIYDPTYQKHIYLFGEYHTNYDDKPKMIKFTEYIDNIFKTNSTKTFDFFLESSYYKDKHVAPNKQNKNMIFETMRYFTPYFYDLSKKSSDTDNWANVRFHSVDIRNYMHDQKLQKDEICEFTIMTSLFDDIYRKQITKLKMVHLNLIKKYIYDTIANKMYDVNILLENRWKIINQHPKYKRNLINIYDK